MTIKAGDKVFYKSVQILEHKWLPSTVQHVGPNRITIRDDKTGMRRLVSARNLRAASPEDLPRFEASQGTTAYPCGCSAAGAAPLPAYCPEHGSRLAPLGGDSEGPTTAEPEFD